MRILYARSFERDIEDIRHNSEIKKRLVGVINNLKAIGSLNELHGIKKSKDMKVTTG